METKIKWNEGEGYITATYEGSGSGSASISSDINEGIDRVQSITVETTQGSEPKSESVQVTQIGLREVFEPSDGEFVLADGGTFNVLKFSWRDKYQEVEYLESTGTQYIDTGFKPNQDTRVMADMYLLQDNSSVDANELFGARTSTSSNAFAVQYNNKTSRLQYFYNNGYTQTDSSIPNSRMTCDANKNVLSYNKKEISRSYSAFQCAYSLYLFALNNAGSVSFQSIARMYSCKIYDNGTLVRDYVPCYRKVDSEAGLYDLVNNKFYANAGTGKFTYGELPLEYQEVEYIESNGTQYIDTGFKPNDNTRIVLKAKAKILNDNSAHWWYGVRKSSAVDAFGFMSQVSNTKVTIWFGTKSVNHEFGTSLLNEIVVIDQNKNITSLEYQDGTSEIVTNGKIAFSSDYNLFIGSINLGGSPASAAASFNGLIYGCKIYDNGIIVRDLVPCVNKEGEYGLYDKVNFSFYQLIKI